MPEAAYRHALQRACGRSCRPPTGDHFSAHDVAAIVFPTTPLPAAPIGEDETVMLNGERVPTFSDLHPQRRARAASPAFPASACRPR